MPPVNEDVIVARRMLHSVQQTCGHWLTQDKPLAKERTSMASTSAAGEYNL